MTPISVLLWAMNSALYNTSIELKWKIKMWFFSTWFNIICWCPSIQSNPTHFSTLSTAKKGHQKLILSTSNSTYSLEKVGVSTRKWNLLERDLVIRKEYGKITKLGALISRKVLKLQPLKVFCVFVYWKSGLTRSYKF